MTFHTDTDKKYDWSSLRAELLVLANHREESMPTNVNRLLKAAGLTVDLSKHTVSPALAHCFEQWLAIRHFPEKRLDFFKGAVVNQTEQRPALHTALRRPLKPVLPELDLDIMQEIESTRCSMRAIVEAVHAERRLGLGQKPIRHVINIGIGGSDLGPVMAVQALQCYQFDAIDFHFIANVDEAYTEDLLKTLDPGATLVIVVSKSFRTTETLGNARLVKNWLAEHFAEPSSVFYGVTANTAAAIEFGLPEHQVLPMWDWVGGRFSLWSAVGLSIALAIGFDAFESFLAGAFQMDQHFLTADGCDNIPVQMGLLGAWYATFCQAATQAVIVYSDYLCSFPDYLQQLHMESLGKSVTTGGRAVDYPTGQILWGGVGTLSQHSFHQLLMCGTHFTPVDFVLPINDHCGRLNTDLIANCLAQSEALLCGTNDVELKKQLQQRGYEEDRQETLLPHQRIASGCPSTLIMMDQITPATLGALIALYEHKVFVQSVLWDINAFDQWGVECGKQLASGLRVDLLKGTQEHNHHPSTQRILNLLKNEVLI